LCKASTFYLCFFCVHSNLLALLSEIDQNTWNVTRFASTNIDIQYTTAEFEDNIDVANKEDKSKSKILKLEATGLTDDKQLCITRKNGKFACPCSFNVISSHDCQDIVAVRLLIGESELKK